MSLQSVFKQDGYPAKELDNVKIESLILKTEMMLYEKYMIKHQQVMEKLKTSNDVFNDSSQWWFEDATLDTSS